MTEHLPGTEPTQAEALRAIRQRLGVLYALHAEVTHEIGELEELRRELLYGGSTE